MSNNSNVSAHKEPHIHKTGKILNGLRAAVLGANDGIISVASIVVGVAGASDSSRFIFTAGIAGLVAGALSMSVGEYVSVSTQRDTENALLHKEKLELINTPDQELEELELIYEKKGLSRETAQLVAKELTAHDAFAAHVDAELGINLHDLISPWSAVLASASSFICGAIIPLLLITISPTQIRIPITFVGVLIALAITGLLSSYAGETNKTIATIRIVVGGMLAMLITFGIGKIFGVIGI
jgi:VIT1/CCC1 family predicted Fe2+/Mn2+ transporter